MNTEMGGHVYKACILMKCFNGISNWYLLPYTGWNVLNWIFREAVVCLRFDFVIHF